MFLRLFKMAANLSAPSSLSYQMCKQCENYRRICGVYKEKKMFTNGSNMGLPLEAEKTTSGRPHGSPLVWSCQWPSSQPLSSPQLSHNDSLWA